MQIVATCLPVPLTPAYDVWHHAISRTPEETPHLSFSPPIVNYWLDTSRAQFHSIKLLVNDINYL